MGNIYQKITDLKLELSQLEIKKSGLNKHLGFKYHELADFLGTIAQLNAKYGIAEHVSIDNELAVLTLINTEKPSEVVEISVPTVFADMQPKNDSIQKLGATLTYLRRYLYVQAYAITEHDVVDSQNLKETKVDNNLQAKKFYAYVKSLVPNDDAAKQTAQEFLATKGYQSLKTIDFAQTSLKDLMSDFQAYHDGAFKDE